jgi:hypothetical protein
MGRVAARRHWPSGVLLLGAAYACSGNPEIVQRPTDVGQGGTAATGATGGAGGALGGRAGSSTGGAIGTTGGASGKGGTAGKGGNVGGSGGTSSGGDAGDFGTGAFGGFPDLDFDYDAGTMGQGGACEQVTDKGTLVKRPMDIIFSIDNSSSMGGEIQAVIDNINVDFANIIEASGIDYRVIMVSRYGYLTYAPNPTDYSVCIGPPLGNAACTNNSAPPLVNTARFFHHSTDIGSNNMWCRLLTSYTTADEYPNQRMGWTDLAPNGWQDWLRPDAFKVFVGITDDRPDTDSSGDAGTGQNCRNTAGGTNDPGGLSDTLAGAETFDRAIRQLAPTQFGAYDMADPAMGRNYRWYSIVGMAPKAGAETTPYEPTEAVVNTRCTNGGGNDDGEAAGVGYQELSRMTGGLRYSNCLNDDFDAMFNAIAQGVIEGSRASCEYDVPVPAGGIVDFDQTVVSYLPGGNAGAAIDLARSATEMDCTNAPGFYFNQDFSKIFLCPNTCVTVQQDDMAEVQLDFGCLGS